MKYQAIFLDFYGTLVEEDDEIIGNIARRIASASPLCADPGEIQRDWKFGELVADSHGKAFRSQRTLELESLQQLLQRYQANLDAVELSHELYTYWRAPRAMSDAGRFLEWLPLPKCIVSNIDTDDLMAAIGHNGWQFDYIVTSQSAGAYKPRDELFTAAMRLLDVAPSAVLHVGDSFSSDVIGAHRAGIDVAWVNRNGRPFPSSSSTGPNYTISSLLQLQRLLSEQ